MTKNNVNIQQVLWHNDVFGLAGGDHKCLVWFCVCAWCQHHRQREICKKLWLPYPTTKLGMPDVCVGEILTSWNQMDLCRSVRISLMYCRHCGFTWVAQTPELTWKPPRYMRASAYGGVHEEGGPKILILTPLPKICSSGLLNSCRLLRNRRWDTGRHDSNSRDNVSLSIHNIHIGMALIKHSIKSSYAVHTTLGRLLSSSTMFLSKIFLKACIIPSDTPT